MTFIKAQEKRRIAEAVARAETRTSGEFVTVLARAADDYLAWALGWAAVIALLIPGTLLLADAALTAFHLYEIQLGVFIACAVLFLGTPLRFRIVPRRVKHMRASRLAHEQFFHQGVHRTRERSGVLFFVSVAEHYVELIADAGIHEKVGEERWQAIIDGFVAEVRGGDVGGGFERAVAACADAMAVHYPRAADDTNELADGLIEL